MKKGNDKKYIDEFKMYLLELDSSNGTIETYITGVHDFFT